MLALTVRQPWAWAIVTGAKDIENRSWVARKILGERITVHAGRTYDRAGHVWIQQTFGIFVPDDLPREMIVGTVCVDRFVTESDSAWFFGPRGWVLTDARQCPPRPAKGALGLWPCDP